MLANRRTKIVATIGPASNSRENIKKMIEAGMNVARLNFSHGTHEDHKAVIGYIRELSQILKAPVSILQDLQGPKIRVGLLENGKVELKDGAEVFFSPSIELGKGNELSTDFEELPQSVQPGTKILLDDGVMEVQVLEVIGDRVRCKVIFGGILKQRKGMNLPDVDLPVDCLTEKDLVDLEFGLQNKVDYVALSFVRKGSDIKKLRELIDSRHPATRIVAKIEMREALENLVDIVELSDAVMVARGDLAVEVGQTTLPAAQKRIIRLCNEMGRPVITATQMLESMIENPRPTRAEITDIANAVLDGSDALMLSAESASGKFPFQAISTMHEIALEVERTGTYFYDIPLDGDLSASVAESIAMSACVCAKQLNASAIVCLTTSGKTATMISSYRPKARIIAVTDILETLNRLELVWGIQTFAISAYKSADEAMSKMEQLLVDYNLVNPGDRVILTLGFPVLQAAKTNSIRVYQVGREESGLAREKLPLRCRI
ncbi:MAG: pyruvate kinase [Bdellovibrionales bacterium]|nr:pyruvate kinase [Bdellovibrionales bacterium]